MVERTQDIEIKQKHIASTKTYGSIDLGQFFCLLKYQI